MTNRKPRSKSRSARPSHTVTISKRALALIHVIAAVFYFFCFFAAPTSPIFGLIQEIGQIVVGKLGLMICMGLSLILGILYFKKDQGITTSIKWSGVLVVLISTLLNGSAVEQLSTSSSIYLKQGGYISWPVVWLLQMAFGPDPMIIQLIAIVGMIAVVGIIIYYLNVTIPLPSINVQYQQAEQGQDKIKGPQITQQSSPKKIHQAKQEISQTSEDTTHTGILDFFKNAVSDKKEEHPSTGFRTSSLDISDNHETIKEMVKSKVVEKLGITSSEPEKPKTAMTFGGDVPTFPLKLLTAPERGGPQIDTSFIEAKAQQIITKLGEFGIAVSLQGYNIGPSVVQIMVTPATGVKISSIESHKDDMMLALKTKSLRIIAPIPGTDSVGIEIPNPHPQMIRLHELIGSQEFIGATKDNATNISLGKGIDGKLIVKSLEKMPHLLVAGATGQGKSVGLNDFIISLMVQNTPDQIKFVMVDPKQVEMELYSGLPYQLCPIITDPEQALKALKRCAIEMDERYTILKNARVKNLAEYIEKTGESMYRIIIVIDELADLMMTGKKKDVEMVIARIAQKARAVGIHLILATQRPSVNVITGLIKANIPCRISFGVVSQIDSRTILDQKGAEDLVGKGDMLYLDTTMKHPIRVQAPFVDTGEIEAIATYLKEKYMNNIEESDIYHPQLMEILEKGSNTADAYAELLGSSGGDDGDDESLMRQAIDVIADSRRASTTQLQKKLSIGFARASRIMDMLEDRGIVGPQEGSKPREVLI